jgi:RNA polymerase sigma-70 factor, ECF subfamily
MLVETMPKPLPQIDTALLVRAQRGERDAHARLYEVFGTVVYTVARRILASTALAEDVLQETFVEVIRKVDTYRGEAEFGFWIKRIAINKCLIHLRSGWVARRIDAPDLESRGARGELLDEQIALERALDRLPDTARAVVWLHDVEGHTHQEIGRMMGRTASFSKSQLARAHERLRALLDGGQQEQGGQERQSVPGEPSKQEDGEAPLCTPELKIC